MHNVGCLFFFQNAYALDSADIDIIMIHDTFIVRTPNFSLKC